MELNEFITKVLHTGLEPNGWKEGTIPHIFNLLVGINTNKVLNQMCVDDDVTGEDHAIIVWMDDPKELHRQLSIYGDQIHPNFKDRLLKLTSEYITNNDNT